MLHSYIEQFLRYCQVSNFSPKSIEALSTRLKQFSQYCDSVSIESIPDVGYDHLLTFVAEFPPKGGHSGSPSVHVKKNRVWVMRQFYHFLKLNKIVDNNIAIKIPAPKIDKKVPHFLTAAEFNRILEYFAHLSACLPAQQQAGNAQADRTDSIVGLRNLIIIMLFGFLGLRLQTVRKLDIGDVDLQSRLIWVQEKGGVQRHLPVPEILSKALSTYLQTLEHDHGPLFLSKRKKRIAERTIQDFFQKAMNELGIGKHLHAHLFRHTAATYLNKVAGPGITQHVLGHGSQQHTRQYTHLNPDIYAVYMKCHPYMNL